MKYAVHEIFYSLQGEGAQAGRPAVFCRFAACNLWSGREEDRETAICRFCDTEFVGTAGDRGGVFDAPGSLADAVEARWPEPAADADRSRFVVCTGGEPLLQLDEALVSALHARGFTVAIETNGTQTVPEGVDWVCVSPKAGADLVVFSGDELKLVFPQPGAEPHRYESLDFHYWYLQPLDDSQRARHTEAAIEYCLAHPRWRLSLQRHKFLGLR
ncbi:MAG: 7-carboxy-7-deazaguanine synthase [Acidobacteria bacterium]|nr:7-carboxy-7-deazaguanine synthase [Acidobacteriota bacterium]